MRSNHETRPAAAAAIHDAPPALTDLGGGNDNAAPVALADTTHLLGHPELVKYVRATLWHHRVPSHEAADAVAEVQADALAVARRGRMPASLADWKTLAATVAAHRPIDAKRAEKTRAPYDDGPCEDADVYLRPTLYWEHHDPVDTRRFLGVLKDLYEAGELPEHAAEILWDEAVETPHDAIATDLGLTVTTVDNRLCRTRARFRLRLTELRMIGCEPEIDRATSFPVRGNRGSSAGVGRRRKRRPAEDVEGSTPATRREPNVVRQEQTVRRQATNVVRQRKTVRRRPKNVVRQRKTVRRRLKNVG